MAYWWVVVLCMAVFEVIVLTTVILLLTFYYRVSVSLERRDNIRSSAASSIQTNFLIVDKDTMMTMTNSSDKHLYYICQQKLAWIVVRIKIITVVHIRFDTSCAIVLRWRRYTTHNFPPTRSVNISETYISTRKQTYSYEKYPCIIWHERKGELSIIFFLLRS